MASSTASTAEHVGLGRSAGAEGRRARLTLLLVSAAPGQRKEAPQAPPALSGFPMPHPGPRHHPTAGALLPVCRPRDRSAPAGAAQVCRAPKASQLSSACSHAPPLRERHRPWPRTCTCHASFLPPDASAPQGAEFALSGAKTGDLQSSVLYEAAVSTVPHIGCAPPRASQAPFPGEMRLAEGTQEASGAARALPMQQYLRAQGAEGARLRAARVSPSAGSAQRAAR